MTDESKLDSVLSRRTFNKGAIASGAAALGLAGASGSAAAQQNIQKLQLGDVTQTGEGLLSVQIQNVNVLQNVNVQDVVVTVIDLQDADIDITVLKNVDVNVENNEILNNIEIAKDVLNNSVVQVAVGILSDSGDVVAAGSTVDSI